MTRPLWSVILAGGAGRRLFAVTNGIPKQFWRLEGQPSLLEETVARLAPLGALRTCLVVDRSHEPYLREARCGSAEVLYQPADRGTGAGLLFGLTPVLEAAPDATVIVTPADHGVRQTWRFRDSVMAAAAAAERRRVEIVIFGVAPTEPCPDYGWILRGERTGRRASLQPVTGFVEKPSPEYADQLFRAGAVWNTMVVVARASALAALFETHAPALSGLFAEYRRWPHADRDARLAERYVDLAPVDFSRDILAPARGLAVATWPASIGWADLGTPDRLRHWWDRTPASRRSAGDAVAPPPPVPLHAAPRT
jgi:mannose-1-phosphate guanylyltransferase